MGGLNVLCSLFFSRDDLHKTENKTASFFETVSRVCDLTGKKANNGYVVTFSHKRNKKLQQVNLQMKKVFWEKEKRWVKMKVSTKGLKSINKVGLEEMAKRANIDLYSLPFVDVSEARTEWLKENNKPPVKKNKRAMNQEKYQAKIAASS
eukprot:gene18589-22195_t